MQKDSKMNRYFIYGMVVESDLEFRQLLPYEGEKEAELYIVGDQIETKVKELLQDENWKITMTEGYLNNHTCCLKVKEHKIFYQLKEGGNAEYLRTYILGFGMAMVALQKGMIAMHCSALADEKGAVLIAGESGSGKSTSSAYLLENGYRLMADDMAFVEVTEDKQVLAYPAFPYTKLCRDAAIQKGYDISKLIYINEEKDKFMAPYEGEFRTEPVPVRAMIMLAAIDTEELTSTRVTGMRSFYVVANNLFLRHLLGKQKYESYIGTKCLAMAAAVPIYTIIRPNGKDTSKEVEESLNQILS